MGFTWLTTCFCYFPYANYHYENYFLHYLFLCWDNDILHPAFKNQTEVKYACAYYWHDDECCHFCLREFPCFAVSGFPGCFQLVCRQFLRYPERSL